MAKKPEPMLDLFGEPIDERPAAPLLKIEYETGDRLRVVLRNNKPWWVLSDVAKTLGYRDARDAGRILRDKQKGTQNVRTPGGGQDMTVISEGGLYRLIMRSRSPIADDFQDWVTDEVLPAIRQTGRYGVTPDRVDKTQRQIKSDRPTAIVRVKVKDENIAIKARIRRQGGCVNDEIAIHNATYEGMCDGQTAAGLRKVMEVPTHVSPLDRMSQLCLSTALHSKVVAARLIEEQGTPVDEQANVYRDVAAHVRIDTLKELGEGRRLGFVSDSRRGMVMDLLPAISAA